MRSIFARILMFSTVVICLLIILGVRPNQVLAFIKVLQVYSSVRKALPIANSSPPNFSTENIGFEKKEKTTKDERQETQESRDEHCERLLEEYQSDCKPTDFSPQKKE